jgi:hypothetical protein
MVCGYSINQGAPSFPPVHQRIGYLYYLFFKVLYTFNSLRTTRLRDLLGIPRWKIIEDGKDLISCGYEGCLAAKV